MATSYTFAYSFELNGFIDSIIVTTEATPAGGPFAATSVFGSVGGNAITGLNTIFGAPDGLELPQAGAGSSGGVNFFDGVDANGISFNVAGGASYKLEDISNALVLTSGRSVVTLDPVTFSYNAPCYLRGTSILTVEGAVPVEALAIGDGLVTATGEHRPIQWIGRRSYAGRFLASNPNVHPVRFSAGCLGGGLPHRDLLVSPEHALFLDGHLIPARCLINGTSIVQEHGLDRVDYFHVELASHDVILAEGAAAESFVDDDSRALFDNAPDFAARHPRAVQAGALCAPRVEDGFALEAIRRRLAAIAHPFMQAA